MILEDLTILLSPAAGLFVSTSNVVTARGLVVDQSAGDAIRVSSGG
jgi:hypothetical protein